MNACKTAVDADYRARLSASLRALLEECASETDGSGEDWTHSPQADAVLDAWDEWERAHPPHRRRRRPADASGPSAPIFVEAALVRNRLLLQIKASREGDYTAWTLSRTTLDADGFAVVVRT